MTSTQLQVQALNEWKRSSDIKRQYHTFEYYWFERYARVYRLEPRPRAVAGLVH